MIKLLSAILFSAVAVFLIFKIWGYPKSRNWKKWSVSSIFILSLTMWMSLYSWEFGIVYGFCSLALIAWATIFYYRKTPVQNPQILPYIKGTISYKTTLRVMALSFISIILAGTVSGCIALLLPIYLNVDMANSLVGGLFLFLFLWPASMVLILSRTSLVKLTINSALCAIVSVVFVYLGRV